MASWDCRRLRLRKDGFRVLIDLGEGFLADRQFLLCQLGKPLVDAKTTGQNDRCRQGNVAEIAIDSRKVKHQIAEVITQRAVAAIYFGLEVSRTRKRRIGRFVACASG